MTKQTSPFHSIPAVLALAAAMLSDPAQADAYHRIMSSAFLQGLVKEPSK